MNCFNIHSNAIIIIISITFIIGSAVWRCADE